MIREQAIHIGEQDSSAPSPFKRALSDYMQGIGALAIWGMLGWQDIKQRYRRSVLGPFWLTISTAIMVGAMGFLYSGLFKQPLSEYLPYVAGGMIVWGFLASIINESCSVFISAEGMIKQIRLPLTVHVCRMVWRNIVIFAHNSVILLIMFVLFGKGLSFDLLSLPLALLIFAINGIWMGLLIGIFCTRFRDIAQIISNLVQLLFFVTPIMWRPEVLHGQEFNRAWIAEFNPAYHFIELMRAPLLGMSFPTLSWIVVGSITIIGTAGSLLALRKFRHRVPYWV